MNSKSQSTHQQVKEIFSDVGRVQLGFYPTPRYKLNTFSKLTGVEVYLKRDDLSGFNVFGGNKIRKLEFLIAEALAQRAEYVLTYGATQSNHAMQTAAACRRYGLIPVLFMLDYYDDTVDGKEPDGNLLLDRIHGAECHYVKLSDYKTPDEAKVGRDKVSTIYKDKLASKNHNFYDIPAGGFNKIGSLGFAFALEELIEQSSNYFDYIITAAGTGGTIAGLLAGKKITNIDTKLIGFTVGPTDKSYIDEIVETANQICKVTNVDCSDEDLTIDENYYGDAYEIPTVESTNILKLLAQREGILLDPVYTAKAMSGLLDYIDTGIIKKGDKVCFWHTGGCTALFANKKIIGQIY